MPSLKMKILQADERVTVYAAHDIKTPDPRDPTGKRVITVVPRGHAEEVFRVDARERCQTNDWTMVNPLDPTDRARSVVPASESSFRLTDVPGISRSTADLFIANGYGTLDALRGATPDDLTAIKGVGTKYARSVLLYIEAHFPDPDVEKVLRVDDDDGDEGSGVGGGE